MQGQSESQLTDLGIRQAQELGLRIAHLGFDTIYCSSSVRTRQTAEHAFPDAAAKIHYRDELREIFLGPWEGHLYEDLAKEDPESHQHFWEQPHLLRAPKTSSNYSSGRSMPSRRLNKNTLPMLTTTRK